MFEMQVGDEVLLVGMRSDFATVIRTLEDGEFICEFAEYGFTCRRDLSDVVEVRRGGAMVYESELFSSIAEAAERAGAAFMRRVSSRQEGQRGYIQ